jgi:hypothetical protein
MPQTIGKYPQLTQDVYFADRSWASSLGSHSGPKYNQTLLGVAIGMGTNYHRPSHCILAVGGGELLAKQCY